MKGQKGEGTKQNQVKGALGATERGPLFPRLHVNETEKAGPKAPPRNKMALYEQFTVPSHRFVQPSQKPATTMYQQQYGMRELGYPYVPYYIPSGPNHGVSMYPQPSHNTSSSGVFFGGTVNEETRHNASRQQKSGKSSPCKVSRHLTAATADCLVKSLPAQKDKAAFVPAQSSLTNQAEESTNPLQNAPSDMEGSHITDTTESLQDALSTVEVGTDSMGPDIRTCEFPKGQVLVNSTRGTCLTDEDKLEQAAQLSIFETWTQPTQKGTSGPLDKSTVQSCLQTESSIDVCKADCALTSHLHYSTQCGTFIEPKGLEERSTVNAHCQSSLSSEHQAIMDIQSASTSGESLENNVHKNASKHSTTEFAKADYMADEFPKLSTATSEELKLVRNRTSEASQTTHCGTRKEGHSDVSVVPSFSLDMESVIKPKDVIRAVGQQQFWKARKKLLRQQRIFSDQVFQLHKLIKIQQLLAETPGTLMDEEMHFETGEDCDAPITSAKRATGSSEEANNVPFNNNEGSKCKSSEAEDQGNKKRGQTQEDGKVGLGSNACRPESSSVGVSAWGYPSLGPWAGPMAAQGGPLNHLPFAGAFPPGSAFGLPMGRSFPGSMMSFGIPFYDGRQEPPAEVDSNDGPPGASKHEGSVNSNHVSNDFAASWYFAQYNHHVNNHRLLAGGPYKDAPTGSGASVNNSSATAQAVKASCFPGLSYQWGLNCQAGLVNTHGLENSAHQSEHSSPINATRLDGHTLSTTSVPLAKPLGFPHRDAEGVVQNLDPASAHRSKSFTQYDSSKKSSEKGKPGMRTLILPKHHQKETVCWSVDCPSPDVNPSALELFPLVPSLSYSGGRVLKAGGEGQGGVIRAVPRRAVAASKSAAGILLSLQRERHK